MVCISYSSNCERILPIPMSYRNTSRAVNRPLDDSKTMDIEGDSCRVKRSYYAVINYAWYRRITCTLAQEK